MIEIRNATREELPIFNQWEVQAENVRFIEPYPLERHNVEFQKPEMIYKTIIYEGLIVGFILFRLEEDGESVEFRRIVVSKKGIGIGKKAVLMIDDICRNEFGRKRVWLDVFDSNPRGIHIYESCGYRYSHDKMYGDKVLKEYYKLL